VDDAGDTFHVDAEVNAHGLPYYRAVKPVVVRCVVVAVAIVLAAVSVLTTPPPDRGGARLVYAAPPGAASAAATAIRERVERLDLDAVSVRPKGDEIVVELGGGPDQILRARAALDSTAHLEFRIVDNNAAVMRMLYARVDGDSDAAARGITADVDSWIDPGGRHVADYYLRGGSPDALAGYVERLDLMIPDDRELVFEHVQTGRGDGDGAYWRSYYVARKPALAGDSIRDARKSVDPYTQRPIVVVDFDREGSARFGELTAANVGRKLATVVGGRVVSAPVINDAIRGGSVSITMGGIDHDAMDREADTLVGVLRSGAMPPGLRLESFAEIGPLRPDKRRQRWGLALLAVAVAGLYVGGDIWWRRRRRNPPEPQPRAS
jgi:protein-export membrane protein SecD